MNPTEHETQVAIEAAAKSEFERNRLAEIARRGLGETEIDTWEQTTQQCRNAWLDDVTPVVWAALQALPDRELQIKHLIRETNFKDPRQVDQFLEAVNHGRA